MAQDNKLIFIINQSFFFTFQVLAAVAVSMGSMIIGFSSAYTSPALVTMMNSTVISVTEEEVIN